MSIEETEEAFLIIKHMRQLAADYIKAGNPIIKLPAYKTSPVVIHVPIPRKGPGRPKQIKAVVPSPPKRMGRPKRSLKAIPKARSASNSFCFHPLSSYYL
jgi:hypothetical protein